MELTINVNILNYLKSENWLVSHILIGHTLKINSLFLTKQDVSHFISYSCRLPQKKKSYICRFYAMGVQHFVLPGSPHGLIQLYAHGVSDFFDELQIH